VAKLEKIVEADLKKKLQNVIDKLQQDYGVDPIGLGEQYRSKGFIQKLDRKKWKEL
jgi:hypothetical protein